ncbi:MAG: penicillin-binding protein 2 [Chloroflexota bacterium]
MSRIGWDHIDDQADRIDPQGVNSRLLFFRGAIVVILGLLLYRVYWVQQTRGQELQSLAQDNQLAILRTTADRGVVFDRDGEPLAVNLPSFNVTITPAFLPSDENDRQAVFERLSLLSGVPLTNTLEQQGLIQTANPELVDSYSRLAELYGVPASDTLDQAGIVPLLPDSIIQIVDENSFAQYLPAVITSNVPITMAYQIEQESLFLPGVRVIPEPLRFYPSAEYTSHILGFMGPIPNENWIDQLGYQRDDRVGWSGLESSMEIELAGTKGERQIEVDWTGREVRQIGLENSPVPGLNMHLTLDLDLQMIATHVLQQAMILREEIPDRDDITGQNEFIEAQQAAIVAMNPQTGEVLAMVSVPSFDNNRFQTEVPVDYYLGLARNVYRPLVNQAISSTYPPGSTFKMVPGAAALQEGVISAERLLNAPGEIDIPNRFSPNDPGRAQTFVCWNRDGHGLMNMLLGIANSCDIYFYKITGGFDQDGEFVEGLGVDRVSQYANQFGFGRVQGIELPLEAAGDLPPSRDWKAQVYGEPWSTGDDYNLGIGQGFLTATPMQVAQMMAVVANRGFLYRPSIIHHMTDEDGRIVFTNDAGQITSRAFQNPDGSVTVIDAEGNVIDNPGFPVEFDAEGNYIFQPEVVTAVDIDREYLEIVADGAELVNVFRNEEEFFTGATWVDWLEPFGIVTAGKTGTAEYCDDIAIDKGWCSFDDILLRRILPTHSWYVGYAPAENPEIVVSVFIYNGGEGSAWATPVACHVMAAYFEIAQYSEPIVNEDGTIQTSSEFACRTPFFLPTVPPELLTRDVGGQVPDYPYLP